jgi:hypothetical protein
MSHITTHVMEMLDAATHENGYPHDYDRNPMDYVAEMDEQSGIDGYDSRNVAHRELAVMGVTKWREKNPRAASS